MDHGVVWITYSPHLPQQQPETLRSYGNENYVIVSPYPGQDAPVIATSWRIQLQLNSASDPRLDQFVNEFKISELAPLSQETAASSASATRRAKINAPFCRGGSRIALGINPECWRRPPLSPPRNVPG